MICLRVGGLGVSLPSASHVLGLCAGANPLAKQSSAPSPTELHGDAYLRYQHGGELRDRHPGSVVVPLRSQLSNLRPLSPPDSPHSTVSSQVRAPSGGDMQSHRHRSFLVLQHSSAVSEWAPPSTGSYMEVEAPFVPTAVRGSSAGPTLDPAGPGALADLPVDRCSAAPDRMTDRLQMSFVSTSNSPTSLCHRCSASLRPLQRPGQNNSCTRASYNSTSRSITSTEAPTMTDVTHMMSSNAKRPFRAASLLAHLQSTHASRPCRTTLLPVKGTNRRRSLARPVTGHAPPAVAAATTPRMHRPLRLPERCSRTPQRRSNTRIHRARCAPSRLRPPPANMAAPSVPSASTVRAA